MIALASLGFVAGVLIGGIGIGGVLLVPTLTFAGVDVHSAISASLFCFLFCGIVGTSLYAWKGAIDWSSSAWLSFGAMPGSFSGALLTSLLSGDVLSLLVALVVISAGLRSLLLVPGEIHEEARVASRPALLVIGGIVGLASSMTGTGGPLLLVPLLFWLNIPVLRSLGLSQVIQIPIAGLGSLGNFLAGTLDLQLSAYLSVGIGFGVIVGAWFVHRVPRVLLTRLIAATLVVVGLFMLAISS